VFISVMKTADAFSRAAETFLKPAGLSGTQYNVLRILRGAGPEGLACSEVGERLISRDPDITRLLDRMQSRGWIAREREKKDRRVVKTRITQEGLRLLAELDAPVQELHKRQLHHIPEKQLRQLEGLLHRAQAGAQSGDCGE
jgi:DNA-binding MarR family transcriptional regulator